MDEIRTTIHRSICTSFRNFTTYISMNIASFNSGKTRSHGFEFSKLFAKVLGRVGAIIAALVLKMRAGKKNCNILITYFVTTGFAIVRFYVTRAPPAHFEESQNTLATQTIYYTLPAINTERNEDQIMK